MPVDQRGRAAASITQPLDAEVLVEGAWRPGAVLGWRHDAAGGCQAQVRVPSAGGDRVRWVDLAAVRLPEIPASVAGRAPAPAETVVMSRTELRSLLAVDPPGRTSGPRRRHASDLTAEFPAVRRADSGPAAGRHRAPAGRHRATDGAGPAPVLAPVAGPLTRPIRLDDVTSWSWSGTAGVTR